MDPEKRRLLIPPGRPEQCGAVRGAL